MESKLYKFCISTIVERGKPEGFTSKDSAAVREGSAWKTGQALFLKAHKIDGEMPVIFSDAAVTRKALVLGGLAAGGIRRERYQIQVRQHKEDSRKPSPPRAGSQKYWETDSGELNPPYAICVTPEFLE
jgi:hypothetical protein